MDALILADGAVPDRSQLDLDWPGWDAEVGLVIAADGGARHAEPLGVTLDLWVGDGDSIGDAGLAALEAAGVPLERARPDKDESDTELAMLAAIRRGATGIVIVGALGGARIDHALANIELLALPELDGRRGDDPRRRRAHRADPGAGPLPATLSSGGSPVVAATSSRSCRWARASRASRPTASPTRLADEPLPIGRTRGLSNVRAADEARVTVRRGLLLVVESPATL